MRGIYKTGTINQSIQCFNPAMPKPLASTQSGGGSSRTVADVAAAPPQPIVSPPGKAKFVDFIPASSAAVCLSGERMLSRNHENRQIACFIGCPVYV